jgi:hypothetical protein
MWVTKRVVEGTLSVWLWMTQVGAWEAYIDKVLMMAWYVS